MIKNYDKYIKELNNIKSKKNKIRLKEIELNTLENEIKHQIYNDAIEYIKSKFDKLLIKIDENIYNFNDNIGVKIKPNQISQIKIETVYYKNKKITAIGTFYWRWQYEMNTSIDNFIDNIIKEIQEIQEKREMDSLKRLKRKFNI